jgi:uncharacterized repeat protein (TIGR01451 family)
MRLGILSTVQTAPSGSIGPMKRCFPVYLSLAALAAGSLRLNTPVWANLQQTGIHIAQSAQQPKVKLILSADKKVVKVDPQGKQTIVWQPLKGSVVVQPGDILRYTMTGESAMQKTVKNFVATQPIPNQTTYILSSAKGNGALLSFSIDGGKTFVSSPKIKVKLENGKEELRPAPATSYTHVRWNYGEKSIPAASIKASYEVRVK